MLNFTANSEVFHSIYRRHAQQEYCMSECYMQVQTATNLVDGMIIKKLYHKLHVDGNSIVRLIRLESLTP